jgi:hypothetical protein
MGRKGLSGSLETMSLPDLLQWASRGQKTGTLVLRAAPVAKKIHFRGGVIIGSSSNDPRDYLGQVLLSEGVITEQQLRDAMDLQARTPLMLGRILVQWGVVTEARVAAVLRHKAEETIYSLFLWTAADFEFLEDDLPPGEQVLISVQVEGVLLEGVRRYDTSRRIREVLTSNDLVLARGDKALPPDIAAKAFPKKIYDLVDGRRTLADIVLEAHSSEFNVCQVLYVMVQRGYTRIVQPAAGGRAAGVSVGAAATGPSDAAQAIGTAMEHVAAPSGPPAPVVSLEPVIQAARVCLDRGDVEEALALLDTVRDAGMRSPEVSVLCQQAEQYFVERAYRHFLPPAKVPVLKRPLESLVGDNLSPEEVFLVSRVNGSWDLRSIMSISPLREVDALRALKKLRERGIIDLVDAPPQARTA